MKAIELPRTQPLRDTMLLTLSFKSSEKVPSLAPTGGVLDQLTGFDQLRLPILSLLLVKPVALSVCSTLMFMSVAVVMSVLLVSCSDALTILASLGRLTPRKRKPIICAFPVPFPLSSVSRDMPLTTTCLLLIFCTASSLESSRETTTELLEQKAPDGTESGA